MEIKKIKFADVKRAPYNPRIDLMPGMPEYERLKKSITKFSQVLPMVYNSRTGNLVGGHQTMSVLQDLGRDESEMSVVDMDEADEKALNIALNKITGQWDQGKLTAILGELSAIPDFDIELTGFNLDELDEISSLNEEPIQEEPPEEFKEYNEDIEIKNTCPKCGYEWG